MSNVLRVTVTVLAHNKLGGLQVQEYMVYVTPLGRTLASFP